MRKGLPKAYTKLQRARRDQLRRKTAIHKYVEQIRVLRELAVKCNDRGDAKQAVTIAARIRTLRQQIKYMGGNSDDL